MEYLDLYNINRQKLGTIQRGEKINAGEYILAVNVWIVNDQNKILLTQRHPEKKPNPLKWESTGGAVSIGEDSFTGAIREVYEEIGIKLKSENGKLLDTIISEDEIKDIYLFSENVNIEESKLQENEVIDIKWVTKKEFDEMAKKGEIAEPILHYMEKLNTLYKWEV